MPAPTTRELISRYAARLEGPLLTDHAVVSPLGVWLLLALVAPAADGEARQRLQAALGTDDAAQRAAEMLADPHPAVAAAVAVWDRHLGPSYDGWARTLPGTVERGSVPTQAEADAWARERTRGMVETFPAEVDDLTALVLASALATDISWSVALDETDGLLRVRHGVQLVAETEAAGPVPVVAPSSSSALDVLSVVAADDVEPGRVLAAAHEVAVLLAGDDSPARRVPVAELVDGHSWTVRERRELGSGPPEQEEWRTSLPAWSASGEHDLGGAPGMAEAFATLAGFARPEDRPVELQARQAAVASYTRAGFRAAAVTGIAMRAAGLAPAQEVLVRRVEVLVDRPFAVLARCSVHDGPRAWRGVPVFSAWVAEPFAD